MKFPSCKSVATLKSSPTIHWNYLEVQSCRGGTRVKTGSLEWTLDVFTHCPGGDFQKRLSNRLSPEWNICPADINHHHALDLPTHFHLCNQTSELQQDEYRSGLLIIDLAPSTQTSSPPPPRCLSVLIQETPLLLFWLALPCGIYIKAHIMRINGSSDCFWYLLVFDLSPLINILAF